MTPRQRQGRQDRQGLGAPYWNQFCVAFHAVSAAESIAQALLQLCEEQAAVAAREAEAAR